MKKNECKCIICGKISSIHSHDFYSIDFCHVICRNKHRREKELKKQEEKRKKKELELAKHPKICPICKNEFIRHHPSAIYCSKICLDKITEERRKKNLVKEKKPKDHGLNQRIEYGRVKKQISANLKNYNSCRG